MFGIKRLLTCLFRISSVLCLCWVRTRYRRGRMPSWLGLEEVACICALLILQDCWFEPLRVDSIFGSSCWRCLVVFIWIFFLFLFWRTVAHINDWFLRICCSFAGEAFFWVQGRNFLFDSCAVESAKVEEFKGAVSFWRSFLSSLKFGGEVWRAEICFCFRDYLFWVLQSFYLLCFYIDLLVCFVRHTFSLLKGCTRHSEDVPGNAWSLDVRICLQGVLVGMP